MRKHRLAERLLADVIGLDWEYVHDEACRWEHVMSEQVERRLIELLGQPRESPYGNPIPGLEELGAAARRPVHVAASSDVSTRVSESDEPVRGVVRRLGEPVQFDPELLGQLKHAGVMPGRRRPRSATPGRTCSCRSTASTAASSCPARSRATSSSGNNP